VTVALVAIVLCRYLVLQLSAFPDVAKEVG